VIDHFGIRHFFIMDALDHAAGGVFVHKARHGCRGQQDDTGRDVNISGQVSLDKFQGFPGNQFFVMIEGGDVIRIFQPEQPFVFSPGVIDDKGRIVRQHDMIVAGLDHQDRALYPGQHFARNAHQGIDLPDGRYRDIFIGQFIDAGHFDVTANAFLVGPSYVFVFYEEICQKWSFFSLREHFSGVKTWL
jgi:hypothetical protein